MKNEKKNPKPQISNKNSEAIYGQPTSAFELINKYGTYEIQPTADSDNQFPEIAQGMPAEEIRRHKANGRHQTPDSKR